MLPDVDHEFGGVIAWHIIFLAGMIEQKLGPLRNVNLDPVFSPICFYHLGKKLECFFGFEMHEDSVEGT